MGGLLNIHKELITNCDKQPERVKFSPATPFAFTEQEVAILSSILNSERAVAVNIQIMRVFYTYQANAYQQYGATLGNKKNQTATVIAG